MATTQREEIIEETKQIIEKPKELEFEWEDIVTQKWGSYGGLKPTSKKYVQISDEQKQELDKLKISGEQRGSLISGYIEELVCHFDTSSIHYIYVFYKTHTHADGSPYYERQQHEEYMGSWPYSKEFSQLQNEVFLRGLRIEAFRKRRVQDAEIEYRGETIFVEYIEKYIKRMHMIEQLVTFNKILKELANKKDTNLTFKQLYTDYKNAEKEVQRLEREIKKIKRILIPDWRKKVAFI